MPTLRPLTDVAKTDAKFFGDAVLPALSAAGFEGTVALLVTDAPDACMGDVVGADVIVEGSQADIEALLSGKQKTELNALDKMKAAKRGADSSVSVRATAENLRALAAAISPREKASGGAKDVASEKGATPQAKSPDRMRLPNGRYVKGRPQQRGASSASAAKAATPTAKTSVVGAQKGGATDRVQFALQNVLTFVNAGLSRVSDEDDASGATLVVTAGEVRRG